MRRYALLIVVLVMAASCGTDRPTRPGCTQKEVVHYGSLKSVINVPIPCPSPSPAPSPSPSPDPCDRPRRH